MVNFNYKMEWICGGYQAIDIYQFVNNNDQIRPIFGRVSDRNLQSYSN